MEYQHGKQEAYSLNPKAREFKIPRPPATGSTLLIRDQLLSSNHRSGAWTSEDGTNARQLCKARDDLVQTTDTLRPNRNSASNEPPSQLTPSNGQYTFPSFPLDCTPSPRVPTYNFESEFDANVTSFHQKTTNALYSTGLQNSASSSVDQISTVGELVDWSCTFCGTYYTGDVQNCLVCSKLELHIPSPIRAMNRTATEYINLQHALPENSAFSLEQTSQVPSHSMGKNLEPYPTPTLTLERLLKHVDALLRLGRSGVDLKEVLVEGDISLCMDLGMKGLFGKEALNPWKTLSINIPDQPFLKRMPKPPLGSVAGDWTCSCGRENWAKRSVCSRCFPGIEPEYKAIVYNRVRPVFDLVTAQMRETYLRQDAERLSSEERRLRKRNQKS